MEHILLLHSKNSWHSDICIYILLHIPLNVFKDTIHCDNFIIHYLKPCKEDVILTLRREARIQNKNGAWHLTVCSEAEAYVSYAHHWNWVNAWTHTGSSGTFAGQETTQFQPCNLFLFPSRIDVLFLYLAALGLMRQKILWGSWEWPCCDKNFCLKTRQTGLHTDWILKGKMMFLTRNY